jgi:LysM repeat protein
MTRIMYDSVDPNRIPASAEMVAGYVDGRYANLALMRARFPHALLVGIAVSAHTDDGEVLDVEQGDATPNGAVSWVQIRRRSGATPTIYTSASEWPSVKAAFQAAGIAEPYYWIAKWDGVVSIPKGAIAKQFETHPGYDLSVVSTYWPGVDPKPKPAPQPKPKPTSPPASKAYYLAKDGDNLSSIAAKYGLSLPQIEKLNPQIVNPNLIYPDEKIWISSHSKVLATYIVRKNDTLSYIAHAHGLSLSEIKKKNPQIVNPDEIYPGDKVYL